MPHSFRPRTHDELSACADAVLAYLAKPADAVDARIAGFMRELAQESATSMMTTTDAHRQAQGAATTTGDALLAAEDEADQAIRLLFGHTKLHNPAAYARLLALSEGKSHSELTRLSGATQVATIRDLGGRISGAGEIQGLSAERVNTMLSTNEALAAATRADSDAAGAQAAASRDMNAARQTFKHDYRTLLDQLSVYYSDEQIAAVLPRFLRAPPAPQAT